MFSFVRTTVVMVSFPAIEPNWDIPICKYYFLKLDFVPLILNSFFIGILCSLPILHYWGKNTTSITTRHCPNFISGRVLLMHMSGINYPLLLVSIVFLLLLLLLNMSITDTRLPSKIISELL